MKCFYLLFIKSWAAQFSLRIFVFCGLFFFTCQVFALPPIANTSACNTTYSGTSGSTVYFDAHHSTDPEGAATIERFIWDFGDPGAPQLNVSPAHTLPVGHRYAIPGQYTATLAVTDTEGLTGVATVRVDITDSNGGTDIPGDPINGEALFFTYCEVCHGDRGTGAPTSTYPFPLVSGLNLGPQGNSRGINWINIKSALDLNSGVSGMNTGVASTLNSQGRGSDPLSDPELQDIAGYIAGKTTGGGGGGGGPDGAALYLTYCEICHGIEGTGWYSASSKRDQTMELPLFFEFNISPQTTMNDVGMARVGDGRGTDWATIAAALDLNTGIAVMSTTIHDRVASECRRSLDEDELRSIADYIATGTSFGGSVTGLSVFNEKCAGCHGPGGIGGDSATITTPFIAGPGIIGATSAEILSTVGNGSMIGVTADANESNLIVGYLNLVAKPVTPQGLYKATCARCHGEDAWGNPLLALAPGPGIVGAAASSISATIVDPAGRKANVPALAGLTLTERLQIAAFLQPDGTANTAPMPAAGQATYDIVCSRCHRSNGWGSIAALEPGPGILGATSSQISAALASFGIMQNIPSVDSIALQDHLRTLLTPTTGQGQYNAYCARCHRGVGWGWPSTALNPGPGILGVQVSEINGAIIQIPEMSGIPNTIDAIAISNFLFADGLPPMAPDFLPKAPKPAADSDLYDAVCARCHGLDAQGASNALVDGLNSAACSLATTIEVGIYGPNPRPPMVPLSGIIVDSTPTDSSGDFLLLEQYLNVIGDMSSGIRGNCP